jgi:prevent-host-death family protein
MITVGVVEARNNFSALLDRVEQGEAVIITRRGVPIARLVPDSSVIDPGQGQDAMQRMRARASEMRLGPFDWDDLKRDRDLGRP